LEGFTGYYLKSQLIQLGYSVIGLRSDLTHRESVIQELFEIKPECVVHLAGISFAAHNDISSIYNVNVQGSVNLLDGVAELESPPHKVILASSATVYGNVESSVLSETLCPKPVNHYGCSKLSMENLARNYAERFPLLFVRPFNYTGIGHAEHFLIPKIVKAYKNREQSIELGNLEVSREFNDVRDVVKIYADLLTCETDEQVVNLCSGKTVSLMKVIDLMNKIAGYRIEVQVNNDFVRKNEIKELSGDFHLLKELVNPTFNHKIEDTLRWMYESSPHRL
jgi:nucleoside-diphosphate-sugar epimerase